MRKPRPWTPPGVLVRAWIRREHARHRLDRPGFARAIGVTPTLVHHWLTSDRGIPEHHWPAIATFFGFDSPETLLAAAREIPKKDLTSVKADA